MKLKCLNLGCPVGNVILEPKDRGEGFDQAEIEVTVQRGDGASCPFCGDDLREVADAPGIEPE